MLICLHFGIIVERVEQIEYACNTTVNIPNDYYKLTQFSSQHAPVDLAELFTGLELALDSDTGFAL